MEVNIYEKRSLSKQTIAMKVTEQSNKEIRIELYLKLQWKRFATARTASLEIKEQTLSITFQKFLYRAIIEIENCFCL